MPGGLPPSKDSPVRKSLADSKSNGVACFASLTSDRIHAPVDLQNNHLALTLPNSPSPSASLALPYVWLRDSCPCPSCVHPETRQKLHRTTDVPLDIKPKRLAWVNSMEKGAHVIGDPGHKSRYSEKWFQTWADQTKVRERYHEGALEMVPWLRQGLINSNGGSKLYHSWKELNTNKRALLDVLTQLTKYGIVFIREVPTAKDEAGEWEVQKIANMFSQVRETMWGKMWDVKSVPSRRGVPGRNVAFTEMDLDLHMDLLYFETPPRYQLIHCMRNRNVIGGQSLLVDGLQAAHTLWKEDRKAFDLLASTDVGFHYDNDGHRLAWKHKTIVVDPYSTTSPSSSFSPPKISALNYGPPFQSPFPASTPPEFYAAFQKFAALLRRPEARLEFLLKEGDLIVFDNRRVLHARKAFTEHQSGDDASSAEDGESNRWLKGCYVEPDTVHDKIRVLRKELNVA
ncbi:hypothetical protein M407DRAFT_230832 [Tulasnella calospora MUT 4182]|uniref:TauD/TfdA-like domain-containing protein n=1 Tax=Tulasnella calospora MUT 4182 TaxID=1051891 RepID=A0A0C3M3R4_9AGAM|nr:hypothetical protein M407DRAFT_230832 [Tulasnella calospora MUT 4182]